MAEYENFCCRIDPVTKRAFDIFIAVEGGSKKDIVSTALTDKIPGKYFNMAREQMIKEGGADVTG